MNQIIQIAKLYNSHHKINFGYVGIDIDTRKIKYYSFYDDKGKYQQYLIMKDKTIQRAKSKKRR